MKKAPVYILLILFLCTAGLYSAEISDTKDSTKVRTVPPKEKGFDLIAIGGLGFAYGEGIWGYFFNPYAPTVALGLEIPFTKAHYFSAEIYSHYWLGTTKKSVAAFDQSFSKHSENKYSQNGTSFVLKAYIGKKSYIVRLSFQLGLMGLSSGQHYSGYDIGAALHFRISNELSVSLNQRYLFDFGDFQSASDCMAPDLLMLNFSYKFKL